MSAPSHRNGGHHSAEPGKLRYRSSPEPGQNPPSSAEYAERMAKAFISMWDEEQQGRKFFPSIDCEVLLYFHRELLHALEPDEVIGRYRNIGEASIYEVWEEQLDGSLRHHRLLGMQGDTQSIRAEVKQACDEFHAAVLAQPQDGGGLRGAVSASAQLFHSLLRIRPLPIANDPIAFLVLHGAYHRFGLERLAIAPRGPHPLGIELNHAIARSLQPKSATLGPLIDFLERHARFYE